MQYKLAEEIIELQEDNWQVLEKLIGGNTVWKPLFQKLLKNLQRD